ncbi:hypothetical protein GCM10015535_32940 [Streptomyces gelaticus]|uniref:Uncharacterized protein n=1 Tax=Streptomyces gelaticus TaxID=285446 RepID=A0ABQ2VZ49_9ACTN|nr:hypothetical protein GCM10015535_32940 [Streptomyces gelaticus]
MAAERRPTDWSRMPSTPTFSSPDAWTELAAGEGNQAVTTTIIDRRTREAVTRTLGLELSRELGRLPLREAG